MTTISFVAPGLPPSKKNTRTLSFRGGRTLNIPGEAYRKWLPEFQRLARLAALGPHRRPEQVAPVITGPFSIDVEVYPAKPKAKLKRGELPRPKRGDLDGILTSVLDALQGTKVGAKRVGGVIEDDYWCIDGRVSLGGYRETAEIKVWIRQVEDREYLQRLGVVDEVMRPARGRKS